MKIEERVYRKDDSMNEGSSGTNVLLDSLIKGNVTVGGKGIVTQPKDSLQEEEKKEDKTNQQQGDETKTDEPKVVEASADDPFKGITLDNISDDQLKQLEKIPDDKLTSYQKDLIKKIEEYNDTNSSNNNSDSNSQETSFENIAKTYEIEFSNERHTNDDQGFSNLIEDIVTKRSPQIGQLLMEQALSTYPELVQLYQHRASGLSLDTFLLQNQSQDFSKFDLKNETDQEAMIRYSLSNKGNSKDDIDIILEGIKSRGELKKRAEGYFNEEKTIHDKKIQERIQHEQNELKLQQENAKKVVDEINQIITKGKIKDVVIPIDKLNPFKDFIFNQNKLQEKYNKLTVEENTLLDWIVFNDFQLPGIQKPSKRKLNFKRDSGKEETDGGTKNNVVSLFKNGKLDLSKISVQGKA